MVRFSDAFNHREPFWYYLLGIFIFMFPASYLIPSLIKFLTSRRPENRFMRTREHGFLLLAAVWIIGFFSISESKLPTYIVPSFPLICLLMGGLLDRKLFSRQTDEAIAQQTRPDGVIPAKLTWLVRTGRRAPFETASGSLLAIRVFSTKPGATQFTATSGDIASARHRVR